VPLDTPAIRACLFGKDALAEGPITAPLGQRAPAWPQSTGCFVSDTDVLLVDYKTNRRLVPGHAGSLSRRDLAQMGGLCRRHWHRCFPDPVLSHMRSCGTRTAALMNCPMHLISTKALSRVAAI